MPLYTATSSAHGFAVIKLFESRICSLFPLLYALPSLRTNVLMFRSVPWNAVTTQ
jgi:hypothetical protein